MLPKASRLTKKDITLLAQGKSVSGTLISMRYILAEKTKVSVSVSKKTISTAVGRNKMRRRIYSATKIPLSILKKPVFMMFIPKKECITLNQADLVKEIKFLFKKAGF